MRKNTFLRLPLALLSFLFIAAIFPMHAQADGTGTLYKHCRDFPRKELQRAYCEGYVNGARDVVIIKRALIGCIEKPDAERLATAHPDTIIEQFLAWAKKHPDTWDEAAYTSIISVVDEAYPCSTGGSE